jgi:hypothetical protein
MTEITHREFGIVYMGDAEPIDCKYCDFQCHGTQNMRVHERLHRRRAP